jgi:hypothetical protein
MDTERKNAEQQLEQVRRNIEQWRQTRTKLGAMPASLWDEAAAVARVAGTHRVSRALGLNYLLLKQRVFPNARVEVKRLPRKRRASKPSAATFVEVKKVKPASASPAPASDAVVVEVIAASGARLTVRVNGRGVSPELATLIASFR